MGMGNTLKWVGIGCAVLLLLGGAAVGLLGYMGFKAVKDVAEQVDNPALAQDNALEYLGTTALPPGFVPKMAMNIPFVGDLVMLERPVGPEDLAAAHGGAVAADANAAAAEAAAAAEGALRADGKSVPETAGGDDPATPSEPIELADDASWFFFYVNLRGSNNFDEMQDGFDATEMRDMLSQQGIRIRSGDMIDQGTFPSGEDRVVYMIADGEVQQSQGDTDGVMAMFAVDCAAPAKQRNRMGLLAGPGALIPRDAEGNALIEGTPIAPEALQSMLSSFDLCAR